MDINAKTTVIGFRLNFTAIEQTSCIKNVDFQYALQWYSYKRTYSEEADYKGQT